MPTVVPDDRVAVVRRFNRTHTQVVGALDESILRTPYSLTEARVIFELAHRDRVDAAELRRVLEIDAGYLSRVLARFETDGLLTRARSATDARRQVIELTEAGREAFRMLDQRSSAEVRRLLGALPEDAQRRVVDAMSVIEKELTAVTEPIGAGRVRLRAPRAGDFGWIVHRHGALYAAEYGWDATFEGLTAEVVAGYLAEHDPATEAAWLAEVDGEPAGSVFCVRKDQTTAKLRLLLVEPAARGHGVGERLVRQCVSFATGAGYQAMELWTVNVLGAARRIYQKVGFTVVDRAPAELFGQDLVGETWRLQL